MVLVGSVELPLTVDSTRTLLKCPDPYRVPSASHRPDGIQLLHESDQKTHLLGGEVNGTKPGNRVRVSGDKEKNGSSGRQFFVKKLSKTCGPCKILVSAP
jgi:hypothetical protein